MAPFDAIVVGSGFGGAVTACRLTEAGYRVLVLERGRRWGKDDFPRGIDAPWLWDQHHPERSNGWLDFRMFKSMAVAQGAGVGGGSLVYANISIEAEHELFHEGWPPEITFAELAPHYAAVGRMMNVQRIPQGQWPNRTALMLEAATAVGHADRFRPLELAVNFDPAWRADEPGAHEPERSRWAPNAEGVQQGTCIHLGECDIGCPVLARNTLDLNYLARAERLGAEVRPLHLVRSVEPLTGGGGYRVQVERIVDGGLMAASEEARLVVLAAGSLGSTELLLRSRDVTKTLTGVSPALGAKWSGNGDFLTLGIHPGRAVEPTKGPTITSAIDFRDRSVDGQAFLIEDGGFPDLIEAAFRQQRWRLSPWRRRRLVASTVRQWLAQAGDFSHVMPWFSQGHDAGDGRLRLGKRWWLFGEPVLRLDWDPTASVPVIDAIIRMHRRLATATGGDPRLPPTWAHAKYLITPHPLGGAVMGTTADDGVVDHRGEVFGHPGLYVADGAIVPTAMGANPSRTIAALAERIAAGIVREGR